MVEYSILCGWIKCASRSIFAVKAYFSGNMTNIAHLGESHDQHKTLLESCHEYRSRSTSIVSTLRNRLVPTVNDSVNFSCDKPYVFKPIAAGYVGLAVNVVTVVFPSFSCKKPSKLLNEGLTDEASPKK